MATANIKTSIEMYKRMQIVIGLSMLAAALSFYFLDSRPGVARMAALGDAIRGKQEELNLNVAQANNLPAVAAEVAKLKNRLADSKRVPNGAELGEFIRDINTLSQEAQLHKQRVTRGTVLHQGSLLHPAHHDRV